jgi:hypothetical protein
MACVINPLNIPSSPPLYEIYGPSILPDDIFELSLEHDPKTKNVPQIIDNQVRNRGASEGTADYDDFEIKTIPYDFNSMDEVNRDRDIAPDEFDTLLTELQEIYISPFKNKSDQEIRDYVYQMWDLEELRTKGMVEIKDIYKGYEKNLSQIFKIYMLFLRHKMVGKETEVTIFNQNIFNRVLKSVYYMNEILIAEYHIRKNVEDDSLFNQEESFNLNRFTPQDYSKNKPFQDLLIYLLGKAYQKGYRLYRDSCYKQIYHNGFPTHAWKYVMPIQAFVYEAISRETNNEMWKNLTDSKDNAKRAAEYLLNAKDKEMPDLHPDRHLFAWTDGLYDAKLLQFFRYDISPLPSNRVAIKFFEQSFDAENMFSYEDWFDIPTTHLQEIMNYQDLSPEVCRIIYAMMGRCLYDLNELDAWQVILFIKGVAGSGKSTIGSVLKEFYPSSDVFILSSNIEKKFGLGGIYDKLLFLCFEVKANWGLDQGDFQCMISGEDVAVALKHQKPVSLMWKVPGMLMGNEVARSWLDTAGSMTRRILLVEFNKRVKVADMSLGKKIRERLGATLHKCNMAYHHLLHDCGSANIWDKIPAYFHDTKKHLAASINPLEDFLENCELINVDPGNRECAMPLEIFKTIFLNFCQVNNYARVQFRKEFWQSVFETRGLIVDKEKEKEYNTEMKYDTTWVYGVCLKENDEMINNS